jgi:hypothetical protein
METVINHIFIVDIMIARTLRVGLERTKNVKIFFNCFYTFNIALELYPVNP